MPKHITDPRKPKKMGRKFPLPDDPAPRPQPSKMGPRKKPAPPKYTPRPKSTLQKIVTGNPFNTKQIGTVVKGAVGVAKKIDSGKKVVDRAIVSGAKNATKFILGSTGSSKGMAKKAVNSMQDPMRYIAPSKRKPKPNGGRSERTLERKYPKPPKGGGERKPAPRQTLPSRPPSKNAKPAPRQTLERRPRDPSDTEPFNVRPRKPSKGKMPAFAYPERYTGKGPQPKPAKPPKRGDGRAYPKDKVPKIKLLPAYPKDKKPKITTLPYKPKPRKKTLY